MSELTIPAEMIRKQLRKMETVPAVATLLMLVVSVIFVPWFVGLVVLLGQATLDLMELSQWLTAGACPSATLLIVGLA